MTQPLRIVSLSLFIGSFGLTVGCATPRLPKASRALSSPAATKGLGCVSTQLAADSGPHPDEKRAALAALLKLVPGGFTGRRPLLSWELPELRAELLRALLESHIEGEKLVREFSAELDRGRTLEEVNARTDAYSRLQALHLLKEALEPALREVLSASARSALGSAYRADPAGFDPLIWAESWETQLMAEYRSAAETLEVGDAALIDAAFSDVRPSVDVITSPILECFTDFSRHSRSFLPSEPAVNREIPRQPEISLRRISRNRARSMIRPGKFISAVAKEMEAMKRENAGNFPRRNSRFENRNSVGIRARTALIHYPDAGAPGNITGGTFPNGAWAITYDDGPGPFTARLLEQLAKRKISATFFVLGEMTAFYPKLPGLAQSEGHSVNSHSHSHPQIPKLDAAGKAKQIPQAVAALDTLLGQKSRFFRLPYGAGVTVASVRELIRDAGLIHVFWNVDTLDWQIKTIDGIVQNTQKQIANFGPTKNRGVILFHDVHERTVGMKGADGTYTDGASLRVIDALAKDANVRFVTLPGIVDEMNAVTR